MAGEQDPPGFNSFWEGTKHVLKKALKWGAVLGAVGLVTGVVPGVGNFASWFADNVPGLETATSYLGISSAAPTLATAGIMLGGFLGSLLGLSNVTEAVSESRATAKSQAIGKEMREMRMAAAAGRGTSGNVAPSLLGDAAVSQNVPMGKGQSEGRGAPS